MHPNTNCCDTVVYFQETLISSIVQIDIDQIVPIYIRYKKYVTEAIIFIAEYCILV